VLLVAWLCGVVAAQAQTTLKLELASSGGTIVQVSDNDSLDGDTALGSVSFSGPIDDFAVVVAGGLSKPVVGSDALAKVNLSGSSVTGANGGTLTVTLSDTHFSSGTGSTSFISAVGGTTDGTTTVQSYVDPGNTGTAAGASTGLQGPFSGAYDDTATGSVALDGAFSIRIEAVSILQGAAGLVQSFNATVELVPPDEPPDGDGRVVPTGTDCQQYVDHVINGTGDDPSDDGDFADGGFNYAVRKGAISNVSAPGAAFYFTTFTAPAGDSFTVAVEQDAGALGSAYEMDITTLQVGEVIGSAPTATCNTLTGVIKIGKGITDPVLTLSGYAGKELVLRFRIDPSSIKGEADPGGTYQLDFRTLVNGAEVDADPDGVLVIAP
jgi:hypothetical protein